MNPEDKKEEKKQQGELYMWDTIEQVLFMRHLLKFVTMLCNMYMNFLNICVIYSVREM